MMQNTSRARRSKKQSGTKGRNPASLPNKPPQLITSTTMARVFRYRCTGGGTYQISSTQLANQLTIAATTTLLYSMFAAVKLKSLKIWSNPPGGSGGVSAPIAVRWANPAGQQKIISDSGMGSTFGAKIHTRPPPQSLASFWNTSAAQVELCYVQLNVGDIIDVSVVFSVQNQALGTADEAPNGLAVTGPATVGVVYTPALDLAVVGTNNLVPVDQKTIT
jgi:hypothetical protein